MQQTENDAYNPVLRLLHWLIALMIICLLVVGNVMTEMPKGPLRGEIYGNHKQIGVLVLVLAIVRLAWRSFKGVPPPVATLTNWERVASGLVHWGLYGLMFLQPIIGILVSQSGGHAVTCLGISLPQLVAENHDMAEIYEDLHSAVGWVTVAALLGHAGAALRHHFVLHDGVLRRMAPWL